ncbi:Beta-galactosidase [bioreactor metagenome]|uniref:Beta-galactosidase n=1 Tax=bioreactor metagenome TaxID=1076179 RepID=A0A645A0M3_9ZZZZ
MSPMVVTGLKAPYFISEHNGHMYPTKSFDRENVRTEHALRHLRVIDKAFGSNRTSAVTGWCMADYNTHKDFGSGDRICYHGVTDMFREPKLAAAVYASQRKEPYMELSTNMAIGEFPGGQLGQIYVFTNCDYIKVYKNGKYTSTAYPNRKKFKNIPHPPVFINDFIGDALTEEEHLSEKTAKHLKKALILASRDGFSMPVSGYYHLLCAFLMSHMQVNTMYNLITKYVANWGDTLLTYTFEGYIGDKKVKTITKTAPTKIRLQVKPDSETLKIDDTYDVTRVSLSAVDQNGNKLSYADAVISLSIKGPLKIIGPKTFSLIGGDRAFWVRTTGEKGVGIVTVQSNIDAEHEVVITVE